MVNRRSLEPASDATGESDEETKLLRQMSEEARDFILNFKWCPPIDEIYLGYGIGGVVGIFLVTFRMPIDDDYDDELWVIVGDLPSAYLVVDDAPHSREALRGYCKLMQGWIDAVLSNQALDKAFPVDVQPTAKNAHDLQRRMDFLKKEVIPQIPA
jgi:hypothetical protein